MATTPFLLQLVVYLVVLMAMAWPMGRWLAAVADGRLPGWLKPVVTIERATYRLAGDDQDASMSW
jgi:K+-transporting ATPase ATPase A chain